MRNVRPQDMMPERTVFGLREQQLLPILQAAVDRKVTALAISFDHTVEGHPGYQGEKCIPTFAYETEEGSCDHLVMFVKKHDHAGRIEAEQFRFLQEHGAPIPKLYGVLKDAQGCDILFLEHLPVVYGNEEMYDNADLLQRFVSLAARLNSLPISESYEALPHHGSLAGIPEQQVTTLGEIAERSASGALGTELRRFFGASGQIVSGLEHTLHRLGPVVAEFPLGFVHGDFWPFHTGARTDSHELLAIDLGWSLLASRFFDIAPFLGPPEEDMDLCLSREELGRHYLNEYHGRSATSIPLEEFLVETDAVWVAWNSRRLPRVLKPAIEGDRKSQIILHWLLNILETWKEGEQLRPAYSLKARLQRSDDA